MPLVALLLSETVNAINFLLLGAAWLDAPLYVLMNPIVTSFSNSYLQIRDTQEGADIIMVKPALPYLDVIASAAELAPNHPLACYQVSGEYAMIVAGANAGVYELKTMAFEATDSMLRAGVCSVSYL